VAAYVLVHMHQGIRNASTGFKNAIMTSFMTWPIPCGKKSEHQTLFCFFRESLGTRLFRFWAGLGNGAIKL